MGHNVQAHMGKERLIYYRGEVGTVQGARSFPNTGYIVFSDRDVRNCRPVRERRRNVATARALRYIQRLLNSI